jgi:hypothetical protein
MALKPDLLVISSRTNILLRHNSDDSKLDT